MEAPFPTEPTAPKSEGFEPDTLAPDTVRPIVPVPEAPESADQPAQVTSHRHYPLTSLLTFLLERGSR